VHPSTILRLVAALPLRGAAAAPGILGIDDFALRKGHVYGTVLVNMETGDVVDLLPDREAATVEAWLKAHPGASVICRDRAGAYAEGARNGAPGAIQVADRWHMWHNLAEYASKAVTRHRGCLLAAGRRPEDGDGEAGTGQEPAGTVPPDALLDEGGRERPLAARTRARHADIRARLDAGHSHAEISRATGLVPGTVRRFAQAGSAGELLGGTARGSRLDEFKPCLCRRWNEGARDGAALHAELQEQGWAGSARTVRRYLAQFREPGTAPAAPPAVPKARQITRLLLTRPDHLEAADREQLARIRAGCPHINALAGHITAFAEMTDGLAGATDLDPWLAAVDASDGQPELRSFANGIRQDKEAALNGLTLPYSPGRVEGIVNKVKAVKRQMYGRASFALLRKRIILHPA
jgi:transposase